jgi:cytochrome c oxidase assembly protein subunit 15
MQLISTNFSSQKKLFLWLIVSAIMIIVMIFLGGITRLTHSGLSIVEWRPISGIIPPFTQETWLKEFIKYQRSPEYLNITNGMSLSDFKYIYLLEYIHRLAARITGIIFIVPFIYFFYTKKLSRRLTFTVSVIFILGLIQAFLGWYMVKSGLYDRPYVSHFRLTIHLLMAFIIFTLILWQALNLTYSNSLQYFKEIKSVNFLLFLSYSTLAIIVFQVIFGGLVAGLKAGYIYNNFPFMGDKFIAYEVFNNNSLLDFINNPASTQFAHRILGMLSFILSIILVIVIKKHSNIRALNISTNVLTFCICFQFVTGIVTLIKVVPIFYASIHQLNSTILYGTTLYIINLLSNIKTSSKNV